jgi:hypothetical protein
MTTDEAFATLRAGVTKGHDRDAAAMALAMITVADAMMSKLERIAVASETLAGTVGEHYGIPTIWTKPT